MGSTTGHGMPVSRHSAQQRCRHSVRGEGLSISSPAGTPVSKERFQQGHRGIPPIRGARAGGSLCVTGHRLDRRDERLPPTGASPGRSGCSAIHLRVPCKPGDAWGNARHHGSGAATDRRGAASEEGMVLDLRCAHPGLSGVGDLARPKRGVCLGTLVCEHRNAPRPSGRPGGLRERGEVVVWGA